MVSVERTRRALRRRAHAILAAAILVCGGLMLDPALASALPPCPVHEWLGILCPGCGATRAVLALMHGHFTDAWNLNPLFVILLPAALCFVAESYRRALLHREFRWPRVPAPAMYAVATAACAFMIFRNIA